MNLESKIDEAQNLVHKVLAQAKTPAIMSSFGKDSMVMLHLIRSLKRDLPIVFYRESFMPKKYRFANAVIDEWDLTVYDYPPSETAVVGKNGCVEVINAYTIGKRSLFRPTGFYKPEGGGVSLCALHDIYLKATGTYAFPWDVVFVGHKSTDVDPIEGEIPLDADYANYVDCASIAYPLRHFTDQDIWDYTEKFNLPIHHSRYEKIEGKWSERKDKRFNPDYFPACTACMVPESGSVPCPRLGGSIVSNISDKLRWLPKQNFSHMTSN